MVTDGNSSRVVAELDGINDRLEFNGDSIDLLFRDTGSEPRRPLAEAMVAAEAAMVHANDSVPPDIVEADGIEPSPAGPVVSLALIEPDEHNRAWLSAFTAELTRAEWSGTLTPAPRSPSEWIPGLDTAIRPAAYLAFRMNEEPPPGTRGRWGPPRWAVDAETTTALCRYLVDWAALPEAAVQLTMGRFLSEFSGEDVSEHLEWAAEHDRRAGVAYVAPVAIRRADLRAWGQVTCQVTDHNPDW